MYKNGDGVEKNISKALALYNRKLPVKKRNISNSVNVEATEEEQKNLKKQKTTDN